MAPLGTLAADLLGDVLSVLLLPIDERMSSIMMCGSWVHVHQAVRGPNVIWSSLGPVCNLAAIYFNIDVFLSKEKMSIAESVPHRNLAHLRRDMEPQIDIKS